MMVMGSLSAGVPNATAVTGNEQVSVYIWQSSNFDWNAYTNPYYLGSGASYTTHWTMEKDNQSFSSGSVDHLNVSNNGYTDYVWNSWSNLSSGYYCLNATLYEYLSLIHI